MFSKILVETKTGDLLLLTNNGGAKNGINRLVDSIIVMCTGMTMQKIFVEKFAHNRERRVRELVCVQNDRCEEAELTWGELERRLRERRGRGRLLSGRLLRLLLLLQLVLVLQLLVLLHLMLLQPERTAAPALRGQLGHSFPVGAALQRGAGHPCEERSKKLARKKLWRRGGGGGAGRGDATEPRAGAKGRGAVAPVETGRGRRRDAKRVCRGASTGAAPLDAFDSVGIGRRTIRRRGRDHNTVEAESHCYQQKTVDRIERTRSCFRFHFTKSFFCDIRLVNDTESAQKSCYTTI